jgi:hypothetical protein
MRCEQRQHGAIDCFLRAGIACGHTCFCSRAAHWTESCVTMDTGEAEEPRQQGSPHTMSSVHTFGQVPSVVGEMARRLAQVWRLQRQQTRSESEQVLRL